MKLFLICRNTVNRPDSWIEVDDEERKQTLCKELHEALLNPKTCVQVSRELPRYRVHEFEQDGDKHCFTLVQAVPLH